MILDTNALSAVADDDPAAVRAFNEADSIELPVVVLGEYRFGIAFSRKRNDYEDWLSRLLPTSQVLDIDEQTTHHYAEVRSELKRTGTPIPSNDAWIAALCRQRSLPLLSRDRHFDAVRGVKRLAW